MRTVASVLKENHGIGPGFDFLRLALALLILFWHCFTLCYGIPWSIEKLHGPWRLLIFTLVPSFFALSGFLVVGSLARVGKLSTFILFRVLRILPALVVETCLSALLLGALVTTLPLNAYFHSPEFFAYMLNMLGMVHFQLPGVFEANPWPNYVNFSLWTVPAELNCYILLALLMLAGIAQEKKLLLTLFVLSGAALALATTMGYTTYATSDMFPRPMLICCFAAGNLFYLWADRIPLKPWLLCGCGILYCLTVLYSYSLIFSLGALAIAYVTVYIGLTRIPRIPLLMRGDYSYGIYLYAYPIQQTVVWLLPSLREFYYVFLIATPATVLFAIFSWHCVEKPALALRKKFVRVELVHG